MSEMIGEFPALHQTIVAERDIYLTHTLRQATRCVEAPHNSQSNYSSYLSFHLLRWRFQLCWHLSVFFFSICIRGFTKLTDGLASKVLEPAEKLHYKINIEPDLNTEIFSHLISICNVTLETTGMLDQLFPLQVIPL